MNTSLRLLLPSLSLVVCASAFGSRGVLKADGVIRVKGADIHSASVTVVPSNAVSYVLPVDAKHIMLHLPLDDVYLISVQREGCPTKEVYFDTRVPVEMHAAEFAFPFMVSLEHMDAERMFAYAAPVGFVRYVHALKDFGYETQYVIRVKEELNERMTAMTRSGVDPKVIMPFAQAQVIERPSGAYSAPLGWDGASSEGTLAPRLNEVPRLVHVVNSTQDPGPKAPPREKLAQEEMTLVLTSAPLAPLAARQPLRATVQMSVQASQASASLTGDAGSRTDEVITEPRCLIHIVRFTQVTGTVHEYRKVVHAFGGVYFFQDNISITERAFLGSTKK